MSSLAFASWSTFDNLIIGGFPTGKIIEVVGESGTGKTQLCLQTMVTIQLDEDVGGLGGNSVYIHTNGNFPSTRVVQISNHIANMFGQPATPLDYISVKKVGSIEEVRSTLAQLEQLLENSTQSSKPCRLLVFDSIASLCRAEYVNNVVDMGARASFLKFFGDKVKVFANRFQLTVLLINEVFDVIPPISPTTFSFRTSGHLVTPCLGPFWARHVNIRIILCKENSTETGETIRHAIVTNGRRTARGPFVITTDGVH